MVGAAIKDRMVREDKPGVVDRSLSSYSTWWNGGLRTEAYFHNMIGILTESIGNPTPMKVPFVPERLLRFADEVLPLSPLQEWHFQAVHRLLGHCESRAHGSFLQRNKETMLFNTWKMGHDEIKWGSEDNWIVTPKVLAAVEEKAVAERPAAGRGGRGGNGAPAGAPGDVNPDVAAQFGGGTAPAALYAEFRKPEARMPRGYIIPANQPDFLTAEKFLVALQKVGIIVHRASAQFTVAGKTYPAGSYVVKSAQSYRPDVLDMFEPQDHPNDFKYPGAPPTRPYDNAGWTLALQMGVHFDRILDGFDGPFVKLDPLKDRIMPAATTVATTGAGWTLSPKVNDLYHALKGMPSLGGRCGRADRLQHAATKSAENHIPPVRSTSPLQREEHARGAEVGEGHRRDVRIGRAISRRLVRNFSGASHRGCGIVSGGSMPGAARCAG